MQLRRGFIPPIRAAWDTPLGPGCISGSRWGGVGVEGEGLVMV